MTAPKPKKRFSQHFLVNPLISELAVDHANLRPEDNVLEIGPGKGILSEALIKTRANINAVEIDRNLGNVLQTAFKLHPEIRITVADITKINWDETVFPGEKFSIVSNLPYNISSWSILKIVANRKRINCAVLLLQKEFADRILGNQSMRKKQYGSLSVVSSVFFERYKISDVSANDFYPRPKVESLLISLIPKANVVVDAERFSAFAHACFTHKRKLFKKSLEIYAGRQQIPMETFSFAAKWFNLRPDAISPEDYLLIFNTLESGRIERAVTAY